MREAFLALQAEKDRVAETPVAVVFTKWDRKSPIESDRSKVEEERLAEFLASHPAHRSLVDAIRNLLAAQPEPLARSANSEEGQFEREGQEPVRPLSESDTPNPDNGSNGKCKVFVSSAFGKTAIRDGHELPSGGEPFGVIDPFAWLARRHDEIDAARLQRELQDLNVFWYGATWRFRRYRDLRRRARVRLDRIPERSPAARAIRTVARGAEFRFLACAFAWLLLLVLAADLVYEKERKWNFDRHVAAAGDPQTAIERLNRSREWFDEYRGSWNGWILAPSKRSFTAAAV